MKIRIATYNCENYFLSRDPEIDKSAKAKTALIKTIDLVDADILCLQEVENQDVLEEINQGLEKPYDYYLLEQGNSSRGINVGMMSRLIFEGESHKNTELKTESGKPLFEYRDKAASVDNQLSNANFQRDLYLCEFNVGGKSLLVFNTHFKSRKNYPWLKNDADVIRLAEASMTKEIVSQYIGNQASYVVLAGDLNQRYKHKSIQPLTRWAELYDPVVNEIISAAPKTTTYHSKPKERIDYLLLGQNLRPYYVEPSAKIHRSNRTKTASDHLPVSIDLEFD